MSNELMIFSALAMGGIAAYLAKRKKKDPFLWFCIGAFFGLLGVLYLYFFAKPAKKTEEPPLSTVVKASTLPQKFWYYLDQENHQFGPMSFEALNQAWKDGKVSINTYVWNEDLESWKPFGELIPEG